MTTIIKKYNPCTADDHEIITAKVWELLRRNKKFQQDANSLLDIENETEQEAFLDRISHAFACEAFKCMLPAHCEDENAKENDEININGALVNPGPILTNSSWLQWLKEFKAGIAPLKLTQAWPETPQNFRVHFISLFKRSSPELIEITPDDVTFKNDPKEDELIYSLLDLYNYWQDLFITDRIIAIPRIPLLKSLSGSSLGLEIYLYVP